MSSALIQFPPPPRELGIDPIRFSGWREGQYGMAMDAVDCMTRFSGHCAPCGSGKSLAIIGFARITSYRVLYLTSFKGLQDQLVTDFEGLVADLRGKSNYYCSGHRTDCDTASTRCELRGGAMSNLCPHKTASAKAQEAQIVITNYACWMHLPNAAALGEFDAIVMDEAETAIDALLSFLAFELSEKEVGIDLRFSQAPHWNDPLRDWITWARDIRKNVDSMLKDAEKVAKESEDRNSLDWFTHIRGIARKVTALATMEASEWIAEVSENGIKFDPIWPGRFAEKNLFRGIGRVLLFSGTLNRKTMSILNIRNDDSTFYDYPSRFHVTRSPLMLLPVGAFKYPVSEELMAKAVMTIDNLTDVRLDRKGMFHSISFTHLEQYTSLTRHKRLIFSNNLKHSSGGRRTTDKVEEYKKATPPAILASPSITAGWDFPGDYCRYQILLKVPFPDITSLVAKARKKMDPEYYDNSTMTSIVQISSRIVRSESDWGETLCLDTRLSWFLKSKAHLAPKWFLSGFGGKRFYYMNEGVLPSPMRG